MIFLILMGLVFLISIIWAIKDREIIIVLLALIICGCLFIISILPTAIIIQFAEPSQVYETQEKQLAPIDSKDLYIGIDATNKTKTYYFIEKPDDKESTIDFYTAPAGNAKIYKDNPTQPYVKIEKKKYSDVLSFFFLFLCSEDYYEFHI